MTTKRSLRDQVLRVLLGGPAYGSQVVERLADEDPAGVRSAVRRLLRDRAIVRAPTSGLSIALSVDDLRALHMRHDADADPSGSSGRAWTTMTATLGASARKGR